jgi:uncharacterized protein (DUF58 family)
MGFLILIIIVTAFCVGWSGKEPALTLSGAAFLSAWAWSLIAGLCLSLANYGRAFGFSVGLSPREIPAGSRVELIFPKAAFFRLPGILVRCRVCLKTQDGRVVEQLFDPGFSDPAARTFPIPLRGAYYSDYDIIVIGDALGFFEFLFYLPQGAELSAGPRILASPKAAEEALPLKTRSGGVEQRTDVHYRRTDDLTDHRPYIPGDDPRRINWKLYSHGGSLFVREGEPEPPPHSLLLIVVDTETDPVLYSLEAGRRAVDLLCENALAAALECSTKGMDVLAGYSGGKIQGGTAAELAVAMALPASLPLCAEPADYPESDRAYLILALPRTAGGDGVGSTALDRFLRKRDARQRVDIVFFCEGEKSEAAAKTCAAVYGQREGIHVRCIR